jgi:hypothetical protein
MAALADEGMEVEDPVEDDPEVQRLRRLAEEGEGPDRPRFTFLRVKWGVLDAPAAEEDGPDIVDWTGALRVDRGVVVVRRVIRFERPHDHLVFPRLGPRTVAWVSHTGRHFDGLLIEIIEPPASELAVDDAEPNRLHFETGPFSGSFAVAELPDLEETIDVAPAGNAIHFNGFTLADLNPCPKGFLSGLWRPLTGEEAAADTSGVTGRFRGRWIGLHGHLQGYLRGAYGIDDGGNRVFFGKYIDRFGRFCGFLRGTWEPADEARSWSHFTGAWVGAGGQNEGLLGGRAFNLPVHPGGFFEGRWVTTCDPEAAAMIP